MWPSWASHWIILEGLLLCFPAFIAVHAQGFARGGLAQGLQVLFIAGHADLHFEERAGLGFEDLFADNVRFIDADGETGDVLVLAEAQAEQVIDRLLGALGRPIQQGEIQGALGRQVTGRDRLEVLHAPLNVVEREAARVHLPEKGLDRVNGFAVARERGRFAAPQGAVGAKQFDGDHFGDVRARAARDGPGVSEMQIQPFEIEFHTHNKPETGQDAIKTWSVWVAAVNLNLNPNPNPAPNLLRHPE